MIGKVLKGPLEDLLKAHVKLKLQEKIIKYVAGVI